MLLRIVSVGKTRSEPWRLAEARYLRRIERYLRIEQKIVREASPNAGKNADLVRKAEADALRKHLVPKQPRVALDRRGRLLTSEELAEQIRFWQSSAVEGVAFLIGGPLGLAEELIQECDWSLALSRMTLPHELAKVVLLEQIYRACTILRGEKYHK